MRSVAAWSLVLDETDEEIADDSILKIKRQRRVYPRPDYYASAWAIMLRDRDLLDHSTRAARVFRRRFRIPYMFFVELVRIVKQRQWFTLGAKDATGCMVIPAELKVGAPRSCTRCFVTRISRLLFRF